MAATYSEAFMRTDDEVIVSVMEHHSNIVPWQLAAARKGIRLRVIPMSDDGLLDMTAFEQLFNEHTKMVSVAQVSNVLGTVNPIKEIVSVAHAHGVPVMVDGAQSAPTSRLMCRTWTATSLCSADIRCTVPQASACSMERKSGSTNCLLIREVEK